MRGELGEAICWRTRLGQRKPMENHVKAAKARRERLKGLPLAGLRPRAPRTASRFRAVLQRLADVFAK